MMEGNVSEGTAPCTPGTLDTPVASGSLLALDTLTGHGRYEKKDAIGEGTFAKVYLAVDRMTGQNVAIKKIRVGGRDQSANGVDFTSLREIKFLSELNHPNIVPLLDVYSKGSNVHLVFEAMRGDLSKIVIKNKAVHLSLPVRKGLMIQILEGIEYMHDNHVLHRDLKGDNLLVGYDGSVKITDFGLSKEYGDARRPQTPNVVTLWYRAPELLYHADHYGVGVDIWACGCIFAEFFRRDELLKAERNSEISQLECIYNVFGSPTEETWPGLSKMKHYWEPKRREAYDMRQIFTSATAEETNLLMHFFTYNPQKRITAKKALEHSYFSARPGPTPPGAMPYNLPQQPRQNVANHTENV